MSLCSLAVIERRIMLLFFILIRIDQGDLFKGDSYEEENLAGG
jgi:hypothetical protein